MEQGKETENDFNGPPLTIEDASFTGQDLHIQLHTMGQNSQEIDETVNSEY
jgi:hypothetical protein